MLVPLAHVPLHHFPALYPGQARSESSDIPVASDGTIIHRSPRGSLRSPRPSPSRYSSDSRALVSFEKTARMVSNRGRRMSARNSGMSSGRRLDPNACRLQSGQWVRGGRGAIEQGGSRQGCERWFIGFGVYCGNTIVWLRVVQRVSMHEIFISELKKKSDNAIDPQPKHFLPATPIADLFASAAHGEAPGGTWCSDRLLWIHLFPRFQAQLPMRFLYHYPSSFFLLQFVHWWLRSLHTLVHPTIARLLSASSSTNIRVSGHQLAGPS